MKQVEDIGRRFKVKKDFKLNVKSLKIACNFPEMKDSTKCYVMDVFIFLEELNVSDSANQNWSYRKLFDYTDEDEKNKMEQKKQRAASFAKKPEEK